MTDQWRVACPGISLSTSLKARGLPHKLEVSGAEQMDEYDIKILLVPFEAPLLVKPTYSCTLLRGKRQAIFLSPLFYH